MIVEICLVIIAITELGRFVLFLKDEIKQERDKQIKRLEEASKMLKFSKEKIEEAIKKNIKEDNPFAS